MELVAIGIERAPDNRSFRSPRTTSASRNVPPRAAALVERMARGKIEPPAGVDHRALQEFGELDQVLRAGRRARVTVGDEDRIFRVDQETRGFRDGAGIALRRRRPSAASGCAASSPSGIGFSCSAPSATISTGSGRRRHRDLVGAHAAIRRSAAARRDCRPIWCSRARSAAVSCALWFHSMPGRRIRRAMVLPITT